MQLAAVELTLVPHQPDDVFDARMSNGADAGSASLFLFSSAIDCDRRRTSEQQVVLAAPVAFTR